MRKILVIMFILSGMIVLTGVAPDSKNSGWEIVKTFKSIKEISDTNLRAGFSETADLRMGFLNEKTGFAVNRGNHVYYSEDGGAKWSETVIQTQPCLSGMELIDESNLVIGCECSFVEYSSDKGKTWNKTEESSYPVLSFNGENTGLIIPASTSKNMKILENFKSIKEVTLPRKFEKISEETIAGVSYLSTDVFYILLAGKGVLLKTTDGGKNWETVSLEKAGYKLFFQNGVTSMRFLNPDNGTIVTFNTGEKSWISLTTQDGGKHWKYSKIFKTNVGWRSYLSRDNNYLTIVNMDDNENPVVLLKRTM